jgi:hypothetical protein
MHVLDAGAPDSHAMLCCGSLLLTPTLCADLFSVPYNPTIFPQRPAILFPGKIPVVSCSLSLAVLSLALLELLNVLLHGLVDAALELRAVAERE